MSQIKDMTGERFGRLTVISRAENRKDGRARWLCLCDCGNEITVYGYSLRGKHTVSCGCFNKEKCIQQHTTHGLRHTRVYRIWSLMKHRCNNPNNSRYSMYGGRGIKVCDEWQKDFKVFYNWAMKNGYSDDLSIDRIDNDRGYYPDNCRWVTMEVQASNKANNVRVTVNGITHTIAEWAIISKVSYNTLYKKYRAFAKALQTDVTELIVEE